MTTIGNLIEMLSMYPKDAVVQTEQNEQFIHIVNIGDTVLLSTTKPIGFCNRSGEYVYPTQVEGYKAFSPMLDEDLYSFEFETMENYFKES
jgi:hypothetical protein